MKKLALLIAILIPCSAHAFFIFDTSPNVKTIIKECKKTGGLRHVGHVNNLKLYARWQFWDIRKKTPLDIMHNQFHTWQSANSVDDSILINIIALGSLSDILNRVSSKHRLCIVMDWTNKNYYIEPVSYAYK